MFKKADKIDERLLKLMEDYGLSRNAFANKIGVSPSVIQNIVKGRSDGTKNKPSFDVLAKILYTFDDIDAYWLISGETKLNSTNPNDLEILNQKEEEIQTLKTKIQALKAEIYDIERQKK